MKSHRQHLWLFNGSLLRHWSIHHLANSQVYAHIYSKSGLSMHTSTSTASESFFKKIRTYTDLSKEAEEAWQRLLAEKTYEKGENFVSIGQTPKRLAFVVKGLFSQYYINDAGETIIKYFFPEGRIAGSIPATLTQSESLFDITALEETTVLEYDFQAFKQLVAAYADVTQFYIRYLEQHWVIDKEPYEVSLRSDSAKLRYADFLRKYPELVKRLKKHQIAAYLGITPTQLSRIFGYSK